MSGSNALVDPPPETADVRAHQILTRCFTGARARRVRGTGLLRTIKQAAAAGSGEEEEAPTKKRLWKLRVNLRRQTHRLAGSSGSSRSSCSSRLLAPQQNEPPLRSGSVSMAVRASGASQQDAVEQMSGDVRAAAPNSLLRLAPRFNTHVQPENFGSG